MAKKGKTCAIAAVAVSLLLASAASAQAPAAPGGAEVMKRIPAGCMGFAVVRDVGGLSGKIDALIKQFSPDGRPLVPMPVLEMLKASGMLGEGFQPTGSFAAVMLDPQQYGLDLLSMIAGKAETPFQPEKLPVVLLIPGEDPAKLMAAHQPVKDGQEYKLTALPFGWARQAGKHVLVSPSRKAVAAVADAKKSVLAEMSPADLALLARSDAGVWLNFKVVAPILDAAIARLEKIARMEKEVAPAEGEQQGARPRSVMTAQGVPVVAALASAREKLKQVQDVALAVRMPPAGVFVEGSISYLPDSALGEALAGYKHAATPLLHRLPNMPYVLAMGVKPWPWVTKAQTAAEIDKTLNSEVFRGLSAENKAKLRKVMLGMKEQVESMQVFAGGINPGGGQVGMAVVMECKSAENVRALLADAVGVASEVIKATEEPDLKALSLKYQKGIDALGTSKLDVISIEHPALEEIPEEALVAFKTVLGEEKFRLYVAQADEKTVVITMGGRKDFLASALKAAAGTGQLPLEASVAKALAMMPKQRTAAAVFSVRNLTELIMGIIKDVTAAIGQQPPPFQLAVKSPAPVAMAGGIQKTDISMAVYVPIEPIRELVQMFMQLRAGFGPGPAPVPPAEDF
jgi:hypothetical protein